MCLSSIQAIRRLVRRDNLTEEQAKQRIDAQPDNEYIVKHSNVVMSTQWSYEFSQYQVLIRYQTLLIVIYKCINHFQADRAWNGLMEYLKETGQL